MICECKTKNTSENLSASKGCGCAGKRHEATAPHTVTTPKQEGCRGGNCGCGGKGKRKGIRTENTPFNAPDDISEGRNQLGLRGI